MLNSEATLDEIRAKYDAERDKRIRQDRNDQFTPISGDLEDFGVDPQADGSTRTEPITDWTEVLIIGAGFGGLTVAGRLKAAGVEDLRIVEKGSDVGGTWYWNRYPGVQCDIESYIYLPLLEETGYMPSLKYAFGDEIRQHCERIAEHFDLYDKAVFSTEVTEVVWDPATQEWWFAEHEVAAVAADNVMVEGLSPVAGVTSPMHMVAIRDMGLLLGELWFLEDLAADCANDGQYDFFLAAQALPIAGGCGSPVNPIAVK